jgi:hypothetical protein
VWSRIRPRCAISLGKSTAAALSSSRSPHEYQFATDRSQCAVLFKFGSDDLITEERWFVDTEQWKAAF